MDWIEQLFGISPDGGSGFTEALTLAAGIVALAIGVWGWHDRRRHG